MAKKKQSAAERRREQWVEYRRQREEEERQSRVMVITEFDAGGDPEAAMHAMATEILRYRYCVRELAEAIELIRAGTGFGLLRPGPVRCPRGTNENDAVPPAA